MRGTPSRESTCVGMPHCNAETSTAPGHPGATRLTRLTPQTWIRRDTQPRGTLRCHSLQTPQNPGPPGPDPASNNSVQPIVRCGMFHMPHCRSADLRVGLGSSMRWWCSMRRGGTARESQVPATLRMAGERESRAVLCTLFDGSEPFCHGSARVWPRCCSPHPVPTRLTRLAPNQTGFPECPIARHFTLSCPTTSRNFNRPGIPSADSINEADPRPSLNPRTPSREPPYVAMPYNKPKLQHPREAQCRLD